eukprot:9110462-Lingulodinium_polyedra.AAC.1
MKAIGGRHSPLPGRRHEYVCNEVGLPHYNRADGAWSHCLAYVHERPRDNYHASVFWRSISLTTTRSSRD